MNPPANQSTIVVVEDEARTATAVAKRLRVEGYHVEVAHDGHRGAALCEPVRPDLVVLDVMLPGIDRHEVCRRIQCELGWLRCCRGSNGRRRPPA